MDLAEDLSSLRSRTRLIRRCLDALDRRIEELQEGANPFPERAIVDLERCTGCGVCEGFCPVGAISVSRKVHIAVGRCIGCGRCVDECPEGAIALDRERHSSRIHRRPPRRTETGSPNRWKRRISNAHLRISL